MDFKALFDFLRELAENNNREWFESNKKRYLPLKLNFEGFISQIYPKLVGFAPELEGLAVKNCTFRINRDVRFSLDKSPYKINFSAYFSPGGKNSANSGYYLHIQPGDKSFFGGGIYMPDPKKLNAIRQEIDYNTEKIISIVNDPAFKEFYPVLTGDKLKTSPKGYSADHPAIDLLRFKSFVGTYALSDEKVLHQDLDKFVVEGFKALRPLCLFLDEAS